MLLRFSIINIKIKMANGVTTEWEDILVKKGIWNARPKETPQEEFIKVA